jgi:hypothetical protein
MNEDSKIRYKSAFGMANNFLRLKKPVTLGDIVQAVNMLKNIAEYNGLDFQRLQDDLEFNNNVHVGGYSILDDKEYKAWLAAKKEDTEFEFWERYERYLREEKNLPDQVILRLDELTDDILDRLRDPALTGSWDRRGLVVGHVQSGKTSNYTGLITKAFDAGYRLAIVLAGAHNSLRSQTQVRLDEGVLGFDTRHHLSWGKANQRIGVGDITGAPFLVAHSLTSSSEQGDFRRVTAQQTSIVPGGKDPVLFVVKKNTSVLRNLLNWALAVRGQEAPESPLGKIITNVPLLLIDDEADYASANTNDYLDEFGEPRPDYDPTQTNKLIRQILSAFEQSAYVGYTATPFANIFIHHEDFTEDAGEGLFPRSFIINLPAPSNYIGAEKLFGMDRSDGVETDQGLPVIRKVVDSDLSFPPRHKKEHDVPYLPSSLIEAISAFILVCAARRARGDINEHNSMLVHVTRFTRVQGEVARIVKEEFDDIRRQLEYPGSGGNALSNLRDLWDRDFVPTSKKVRQLLPEEDLKPLRWEDVEGEIVKAVKRIEVREINGSAKDALDYVDHPDGMYVIAIGGDKLSRGLTLEGLSVSYFIRTSRMYDTLMQMGRWFGYRPRYADLLRLYTSPELIKWYRHISTATSELREEFDHVFSRGMTPLEYTNRVRTHPDGLLITAANKMRASRKIRAGFSGTISETVAFDIDDPFPKQNFEVFEDFIRSLGKVHSRGKNNTCDWRNVGASIVIDLFKSVTTSRESWKANSTAICQYVENRVAVGKLTNWSVRLVSSSRSKAPPKEIGGHKIGLLTRESKIETETKYSIGRLVDPKDEWMDLNPEQVVEALEETRRCWIGKGGKGKEPNAPSGVWVRRQRAETDGLLLIYPIYVEGIEQPLMGFAVSFPYDENAPLIDYAETSVQGLEEIFE